MKDEEKETIINVLKAEIAKIEYAIHHCRVNKLTELTGQVEELKEVNDALLAIQSTMNNWNQSIIHQDIEAAGLDNASTSKNVERFLEKYSQGSKEQNAAFYKLFRKAANEYSGLNGRRFTEIEKEIKRLRTALAVINTWASADSCNFQGRARAMSDIAKRSQVALGHHKPAEVPECNGGSFSL